MQPLKLACLLLWISAALQCVIAASVALWLIMLPRCALAGCKQVYPEQISYWWLA